MSAYAALVDRVEALASTLPPPEGDDVRRVAEICRDLSARPRGDDGRLTAAETDPALARELARFMETLGRRGARALPAAALARAAFSDLKGDVVQTRTACGDVEHKLASLLL